MYLLNPAQLYHVASLVSQHSSGAAVVQPSTAVGLKPVSPPSPVAPAYRNNGTARALLVPHSGSLPPKQRARAQPYIPAAQQPHRRICARCARSPCVPGAGSSAAAAARAASRTQLLDDGAAQMRRRIERTYPYAWPNLRRHLSVGRIASTSRYTQTPPRCSHAQNAPPPNLSRPVSSLAAAIGLCAGRIASHVRIRGPLVFRGSPGVGTAQMRPETRLKPDSIRAVLTRRNTVRPTSGRAIESVSAADHLARHHDVPVPAPSPQQRGAHLPPLRMPLRRPKPADPDSNVVPAYRARLGLNLAASSTAVPNSDPRQEQETKLRSRASLRSLPLARGGGTLAKHTSIAQTDRVHVFCVPRTPGKRRSPSPAVYALNPALRDSPSAPPSPSHRQEIPYGARALARPPLPPHRGAGAAFALTQTAGHAARAPLSASPTNPTLVGVWVWTVHAD
ncbi:hypothetical protein B0H15DRAFT_954529 [Mycena belliarum]|uniref:Uncharacterized protein n=1 Tax=Mycena belliarum TaxID=1033014 RepID=A0AAD6XLF7_9AGAR|nr:hypothetical protein B0H15DRAFT_954529 [Mycena belliae]